MDQTSNQPASTPNPALQDLVPLAGNWTMELSNASFLPDPSATVTGTGSFEWLENGAYLLLRMGAKPAVGPQALWLIGRDESTPGYTVLYYDDRHVSRIYEMSFANGVWKMWRATANFSQRFEGKLSEDGDVVTGRWEKSSDGTTWEHDFNVRYTRD